VKKKSPPYAIILAVLLGIIAIVALVEWKKGQDQKAQAALDKANADAAAAVAAANAKQAPVVQETAPNMRLVLYATQPVEAGAKISPAFFEKKLTPTDILPDAFTGGDDVVGFYAIRRIEKGDPLSPHNIGRSLPYLSQRIPPGMRAVALPIFDADDNNTGGFAVDGDKVDLLYSTLSQDSSLILRTELVMQNLGILYVPGPQIKTDQTDGITPAPPPGDPISITFEVTPEQAQALIFMSQVKNGRFSMILRGRPDKSEIKIKPFLAEDYPPGSLQKIQRTTDKSIVRVQELAAKIAEEEKNQGSQGNTNETPTPTPPSP
jgi:Flp pilus assembly protein CpaB